MDPQQPQQRRPPPPPPSAPPPSWKVSSANNSSMVPTPAIIPPAATTTGTSSITNMANRPKPPPPRQPPPIHHQQQYHSHHISQLGDGGVPSAAGELRRSESSSSTASSRAYDGSGGGGGGARRYMDDNRFENRRYPPESNYPPGSLQRRASFESGSSATPRPYGFGGDNDRSDRGGNYERGWGDRGDRYSDDRRRFGISDRDRERDRDRPDRFGGDRPGRDGGPAKDITRTGSTDNMSVTEANQAAAASNHSNNTNPSSNAAPASTLGAGGAAKRKPPPPSGPPPIARRASSDGGGGYSQQASNVSLSRSSTGFGSNNGPQNNSLTRSFSTGSVRDDREDKSSRSIAGTDNLEQVEPGEIVIEEGEVVIPPTVKAEKEESLSHSVDVVSEKHQALDSSESALVSNSSSAEKSGADSTDEKSSKLQKQATDEDGTADDDSGDGGSKKGKQKKIKRRKLVIDTTVEPDQDIEDEITPTSASAALRKRRKSRQVSQDSTDTGASGSAPARAAKTRAQELIAKPKTPAGTTGSLTPTGPSPAPTQINSEKPLAPLSPIPSAARGVSQSSTKSSNVVNPTQARSVGGLGTVNGGGDDKRRKSRAYMDEGELREEMKRILVATKQQQTKISPKPPPKIALKPFLSAVTKGRPTSTVIISRVHQKFQRQTLPLAYSKPQEAPGWDDLERWAETNRTFLVSSLQKRFILEQNHAKMVLEDLRYLQFEWKKEEEMRIWKAAQEAQQPGAGGPGNKRYPSRNNPAAIAIELGQQEHGVAEQERRERERRKNAAILPDLEFGMEYRASLLGRQHRDTTDGRPAMCFGRMDGADCVLPGETIPQLMIPSPLGCNCSRAVAEATRKEWTDIERCIFLDKFLQFPKDFKRIASFFRNKTTEDVIAFYYDTKKVCDYKSYMNEHHRRRNRDQSDLVGIREQYLAKLGVRLPLSMDLDGIRRFSRVKDEPVLKGVPLPAVLLSASDIFPKQLSDIAQGVDSYPRPCIIADFAPQIDPQDLQNFLLRNN